MQTQVELLEQQLSDAKTLIATRQMALRLKQNPDFKKLILDGFCLHEAARYVQLSGDAELPAENRADALNLAQASGHLLRFLEAAAKMGDHAERTLGDLEATIDEARGEEGAE